MALYIIKNKRPRFFVVCCLVLFAISLAVIQKTDKSAKTQLELLKPLEREYLTNFFKTTIFKSGFGYTIFGTKPMSIETIKMETRNIGDIDYMDIRYIFDQYRMKEGFEVWQKYSPTFPLSEFSIIFYPSPNYPINCIEVAILNHRNCVKVINEHLADFQSVLGTELSAQQILEEYTRGYGKIFEIILHHDGLLGTLLGYGKENAWEYMRLSGGKTMQGFAQFKEMLDTREILPPLFTVIDDSNETKMLRQQYLVEKERIDLIYQSPDFLEQILRKLTGQ